MSQELTKTERAQAARDSMAGAFMDRHIVGWLSDAGYELEKVMFTNRGSEWLVVVKGYGPDGAPLVCFVSGETMAAAVRTLGNKAQQGELKWREDKPWSP